MKTYRVLIEITSGDDYSIEEVRDGLNEVPVNEGHLRIISIDEVNEKGNTKDEEHFDEFIAEILEDKNVKN